MFELPLPQRALDELRTALVDGPVVVDSRSDALAQTAVRRVAPERRLIEVDARGAGTTGGLRIDLARALLADLLGGHEAGVGSAQPDAAGRLALGRAFGPRADEALDLAAGSLRPSLSFDDLLAAVPTSAMLVVYQAHLLGEGWAGPALWSLRSRAAAATSPWLALLTRPWQVGLTDRDAAFFGFARRFEVSPPAHADWSRALVDADLFVGRDDLRWLIDRAEGRPDLVLEALRRDAGDVRRGWRGCVAARQVVLDVALGAARAAHPLGPRLLTAVARGEPPYRAVADVRPARVAHALRRLRDHDLAYQPEPRVWHLLDPALATALRQRPVGICGSPAEQCGVHAHLSVLPATRGVPATG